MSADERSPGAAEPGARPDEVTGADAAPPTGGADLARSALAKAKEQAKARGLATRRTRRSAPRPAPTGGDRDPKLFGAAIRELLAERGWEQTEKTAGVLARWDAIVGPDVAAHCRPEGLRDGQLVLVAESTAWATQLRLLTRSLLTRISAEVGPRVVTSIRVHGPSAPDWRRGPLRVSDGRGPRDTYG